MTTVWDLADHPERDRRAVWHDVLCQAFVPLRADLAPDDGGLHGRVENRPCGTLMRSTVESRAQHTAHGRRQVRQTDGAHYFLNLQLRGDCHARQGDHSAVVHPGEAILVDTTQPYWFDHGTDWKVMSFRIPKSQLDLRVGDVGVPTARPFDHAPAGRVVRNLMCALWEFESTAAAATEMTDALVSAVAAGILSQPIPGPTLKSSLRRDVLRYIRDNIAEDLSVAAVSARFHISPRTLHGLFEDSDTTFAQTVRHVRLERARRRLTDPTVTTTISQVAHHCGFDDPSTFSRSFQRQFGVSPRDMRAQGPRRTCS
ncbi:helix-turn-helix domain-containing protein [Gordonia sp. NPDC003376]